MDKKPTLILEPSWSERSFCIGLLVGGLFGSFFVVPFVSWMTHTAVFCFK